MPKFPLLVPKLLLGNANFGRSSCFGNFAMVLRHRNYEMHPQKKL